MNKKGFTLIELLAVITLLGLILAISVPSISFINKSIKDNLLNTKINLIEEYAILYGEDNLSSLKESNKTYDNNRCITIIVSSLVPNYLDADNDNYCNTLNSNNLGCITDPSNKEAFLDKEEIIIYLKDNKVKARFNKDHIYNCRVGG